MSYILDALRRADAERERGAVPSLHTQQYGALPGDEDDAPRRAGLPTIVAATLAVALVAVVGWHYFGAETPRAAVQVVAAPLPPVIAAPLPVDAVPASGSAATVGNGSGADIGAGRAAPAPPLSPTATARRNTKRELTTTPPSATTAAMTPAMTSPSNAAAPVLSAAAGGDRIYAMADLPDDVRRDLPKLAFGGASYSSDPGSRMVILNGQVFHEGDGIMRGVVLQRVNRKSAILVVRGYRFELAF